MAEPAVPAPLHRRPAQARTGKIRAMLSLGMVLGLGAVGTMASWSDSVTLQGGAFTTGTLNMMVGSPAVENNPPSFTTNFAMANMVPGSIKDAVLRISNTGDAPFTFTGRASATNAGTGTDQLGSKLKLTAYATSNAGACTGAAVSTGTTLATFQLAQRALKPGEVRDLCFRVELPRGTDTTDLQGKKCAITLTFTAAQTR